ncbi:MAG: glycosyltransferase [Dermatophilaceae bacterium]
MTSPLVSVVVPVFNAERHLGECLQSLFAQTLQAIEIVVVDDGSTDRSAGLLSEAAADDRLRVLTLAENRGVSAARNAGVAAAHGAYVAFVDADDVVSPTMYEALYQAARDAAADIVFCGIRVVGPDGVVISSEPPPLSPGHVYSRACVHEVLHRAWELRLLWYPVRSIYRRTLLIANEVRFDEGIRKGEDSLFNLQALLVPARVTAVGEVLYEYRKHASSATACPLASESDNLERLGRSVTELYSRNGFDDRAFLDFARHVLRSDLPAALVLLCSHRAALGEVRALLDTETVRTAFRIQRISRLGVPLRAQAVLILARLRLVRLLVLVLRLAHGERAAVRGSAGSPLPPWRSDRSRWTG